MLRIISAFFLSLISIGSSFAQISPGKLSRFHSEIEGIANCTKCHELGKSVLASKCLECHDALKARIDSGKGYHSYPEVTGTTCFKCHSDHHGEDFELIRWHDTPQDFDHSKTDYKLEGAHAKQECKACHRRPSTKPLPALISISIRCEHFSDSAQAALPVMRMSIARLSTRIAQSVTLWTPGSQRPRLSMTIRNIH